MTDKDLYGGLIRLHILHHASQEPIFGAGIAEELRRHGYDISPGTLYPMLHAMEEKGYLASRQELSTQRIRRLYEATPDGRQALAAAKVKVKELFGELFEDDL
jgi:PadR family transcriptional regulator PadR